MKPLLSYYGGKQRMSKTIIEEIGNIPHKNYVEVFGGGLSIYCKKEIPESAKVSTYFEVINDINGDITNLYTVARDKSKDLYEYLLLIPYSESLHTEVGLLYKDREKWDQLTDIQKAAYVFFLVLSTINNVIKTTRSFSYSFGDPIKNKANVFDAYKENILTFAKRCSKTQILQKDALYIVNKFNKPIDLLYLDPPYVNCNQGHYSGYTQEDFVRLCDALDNSNASYILSCTENEYFPKSYTKKVERIVTKATDTKGKRSKLVEILYICDRSENIKKEYGEKTYNLAKTFSDEIKNNKTKITL